jgi:hypothetical protein
MSLTKSQRKFSGAIGLLLVFPVLLVLTFDIYLNVSFNRNCGGHLKRAADANTIELAQQELSIAVAYLEANRMTTGYTSVIYTTPDEDVGFWHQNLRGALDQLNDLVKKPALSPLEQSNVLMKLRQTLLDHGQHGEHVTMPSGISLFPNNGVWALSWAISVVIAIIGALFLLVACLGDEEKTTT